MRGLWPKCGGMLLTMVLLPLLASAQIRVGAHFPAVSSVELEGSVPDYTGKVAVVDFWASWCAPCKASFPAYSRLQNELGAQVVVVGVSIDEKASDYRQFVERLKPSFGTVRDVKQQLVALIQVPTMPTSYVLDRKGVVRFVHVGFHNETAKELRAEIDQLLKEPS